jgi:23S rRNA pseudouridine2605 synthase
MRLNAYLARAGVASRRGADDQIKAGRVLVNGEPGQLNTFVEATDRVQVDGREVGKQKLAHLLLYKPAGVVSTARDTHGRKTVVELIPDANVRLYPVGRLDIDTTGLILLTNDGELANSLTHPRFEVPKTYRARVGGGPVSHAALRALRTGVTLEDGPSAPARARRVEHDVIELELHEGRKRQVRRMCEAVGHPVRALERVAFGPVWLGTLRPGRHRRLTAAEVERLRAASQRL